MNQRKVLNLEMQNLKGNDLPTVRSQVELKEKKFNITTVEFYVALTLALSMMMYHFTNTAIKIRELYGKFGIDGVTISWSGYPFDSSDGQWTQFRENLPIFLVINALYLTFSRAIKQFSNDKFNTHRYFQIGVGVGLLFYLLRSAAIIWLVLTWLYFVMSKALINTAYYSKSIWIFTIGLLVWVYYNEFTVFEYIATFSPNLSAFLLADYNDSLISWNNHFNMTILRILSFCFDKYWGTRGLYKLDTQRHMSKCAVCKQGKICYKAVSETNAASGYDSILSYYAYLFYAPLFITGPIITYNGFINQLKSPQNEFSKKQIIQYSIRALLNIVILEAYCHFTFSPSLMMSQNFGFYQYFTASQIFTMGFSQLTFIWLKFLTIWRLSRAVALIDGINCPENMNRCVYNNYSFEGFWRSWHRSFNQWLIRYIYIPLGGNKRKLINIWAVFTFVAIWHDCQINLLLWAWFICLCLLPEIAIKYSFSRSKLWDTNYFKYVLAVVGALCNVFLIFTNLIGFGYGWDQMKYFMSKYVEGGIFTESLYSLLPLFPLSFVQFWVRDRQDLDY